MDKLSILIVENLRVIAMDIRDVCIKLGYSCQSIRYSSGIIKDIEAIKPDLVLMDIKTDGSRDITDEAEKICNEFNVPIIFFTTDSFDSSGTARFKNRCLFHPIPFMKEELIKDIKNLLQNYSTAGG